MPVFLISTKTTVHVENISSSGSMNEGETAAAEPAEAEAEEEEEAAQPAAVPEQGPSTSTPSNSRSENAPAPDNRGDGDTDNDDDDDGSPRPGKETSEVKTAGPGRERGLDPERSASSITPKLKSLKAGIGCSFDDVGYQGKGDDSSGLGKETFETESAGPQHMPEGSSGPIPSKSPELAMGSSFDDGGDQGKSDDSPRPGEETSEAETGPQHMPEGSSGPFPSKSLAAGIGPSVDEGDQDNDSPKPGKETSEAETSPQDMPEGSSGSTTPKNTAAGIGSSFVDNGEDQGDSSPRHGNETSEAEVGPEHGHDPEGSPGSNPSKRPGTGSPSHGHGNGGGNDYCGTKPSTGKDNKNEDAAARYDSPMCRICLETELPTIHIWPGASGKPNLQVDYESSDPEVGRLLHPCCCRGSSAYVHEGCLNLWRESTNQENYWQCSTCKAKFKLQPTRLGSFIDDLAVQMIIMTSFLVLSVISLGFIADPVVNLWPVRMHTIYSMLFEKNIYRCILPSGRILMDGELSPSVHHLVKAHWLLVIVVISTLLARVLIMPAIWDYLTSVIEHFAVYTLSFYGLIDVILKNQDTTFTDGSPRIFHVHWLLLSVCTPIYMSVSLILLNHTRVVFALLMVGDYTAYGAKLASEIQGKTWCACTCDGCSLVRRRR